jgi:dGTPase
VSADEGHVFHNRLTHTLEVAQVARRLAERLLVIQPEFAAQHGAIDPDVVEAAALAHDVGHPPFGHVGEEELQEFATNLGEPAFEGFEGNAQSFRVVTRLACRYVDAPGLDLTRATLNAILKYPWFRELHVPQRRRKFGAYRDDGTAFEWARQLGPAAYQKSVEAEIMDLADDIAYAVHDMEDFFRARLIPLDRLRRSTSEVADLVRATMQRWGRLAKPSKFTAPELESALTGILRLMPIEKPYEGTNSQRSTLRAVTSTLIARYLLEARLSLPGSASAVALPHELETEIAILKELTWHYVILNPRMVAREYGQRRVVSTLAEAFLGSAKRPVPSLLPIPFQEELRNGLSAAAGNEEAVRFRVVIDVIANMNDLQALRTYHRITGVSLGSVLEAFLT